jgi:hypothetical protein
LSQHCFFVGLAFMALFDKGVNRTLQNFHSLQDRSSQDVAGSGGTAELPVVVVPVG